MIRIRRVYHEPSAGDGRRILIDRLWPRGMTKDAARIDEWIRNVAPSAELRKWFGHDPDKWSEFRNRYRKELKGKVEIIQHLRKEAKKETVTLLYSARDEDHNNAVVLREVLKRGSAARSSVSRRRNEATRRR